MDKKHILVTGANGYIASRLIPELLKRGYRVRCLVRHTDRLEARTWFPYVEVVQGDVMDPSTLCPAMDGVHTAYYLIHNMSSGRGYPSLEQSGAKNFAHAAELAGVKHIIYLGGLADPERKISFHMRSRIETGKSLRKGKVPVTEFRAGVIVGPGSISFEMIRFMTELMPVIVGPVWLQNLAQPIAAQNVTDYLLTAVKDTPDQSRVVEIGGPDRMSYAELMLTYGRLRGLQRKYVVMLNIPLWFMALGVAWMTPVPKVIATPLVDGMRSESIVQDDAARRVFPNVRLLGYEEAVKTALAQLHPACLERTWNSCQLSVQVLKSEGFFIDYRCVEVRAAPGKVFEVIASLGGKNGWLYANWLWQARGWLDRLLAFPHPPAPVKGSPAGRGTRGEGASLNPGDALDFYRVESLENGRLLRLAAELNAPGQGWMEWRVEAAGRHTVLAQTAFFAPRGLPGFLYWHLLAPLHRLVFAGLIRAISKQSEKE
ncbi:MAG: DUF2867 domain-containing protein [Chloroflexota bacterium]